MLLFWFFKYQIPFATKLFQIYLDHNILCHHCKLTFGWDCVTYLSDDSVCNPGNEVMVGIQHFRAGRKSLWRIKACDSWLSTFLTPWGWFLHKVFAVTTSGLISPTCVCFINARVKVPLELVHQLIWLEEKHTESFTLSLLFFFSSLSDYFAVTHPSIDTYFHNSGWNSLSEHLHQSQLKVEVSDSRFIFFTVAPFEVWESAHGVNSHYRVRSRKDDAHHVWRKYAFKLAVNKVRDNWKTEKFL